MDHEQARRGVKRRRGVSGSAATGIAVGVAVLAAATATGIVRRRICTRRDGGPTSTGATVVFDGDIEIDCSAQEAFDLLVNTDRYATGPGSPVLRMERIPEGEARLGTRWREVIRLGPLARMTVWSEIVTLDPPTALQLRFDLPGATGTLTYRIGPGADRRVRLVQHQTFVLSGRMSGLRRWMIERLWAPRASRRLDDIRAVLEGS
jgi:hypothetical protein